MTYGKTTLHGITQSVPSDTNLPDRGNEAAEIMIEDLFDKRIYDIDNGLWLPSEYIVARWDFAVTGGAVGDVNMTAVIPANTIILDGFLDVLEPVESAVASIKIGIEADQDTFALEAVATAGLEGMHDIVPVGTAATMIKTTVARYPVLTIVTGGAMAITDGVMVLVLRTVRGFAE